MTTPVELVVETQRQIRQLRGDDRPLRARRPRRQLLPDSESRAYQRELLAVLEATKALVDSELVPRLGEIERVAGIRRDGIIRLDVDTWAAVVTRIMAALRERATPAAAAARRLAGTAGRAVSGKNLLEVRRQFRGVLGVDIFADDPALAATLDDFVTSNVGLITSVSAGYLDEVEGIVRRGFRGGRRASVISDLLTERFGVARSRANLIGRDQISKLNANLTRNRQTALGVTEYIWRTSRDERVRESHARLEGTRHSWNDPPSVGGGRTAHPGEDFQCRCTAEPVIPGVETPATRPSDVRRDPELRRRHARRRRRRK